MFYHLLYLLCASENSPPCDKYIETELGVRTFEIASKSEEKICIKSQYAPYYIFFNTYNDEAIYTSYTFDSTTKDYNQEAQLLVRFLPIVRPITDIFNIPMIINPESATLKLTLISVPGMCKDGFYFSNKPNENVRFSRDMTEIFDLDVYDDKCVYFGVQNPHDLYINVISDDYEDQIFVYNDYYNYSSICGNSSLNLHLENPYFLRIIADDLSPPDLVSFILETDGKVEKNSRSGYIISETIHIACEWDHWFSEPLAICLIVLLIIIILLLLCAISSNRLKIDKNAIIDDDASMATLYQEITTTNNFRLTRLPSDSVKLLTTRN